MQSAWGVCVKEHVRLWRRRFASVTFLAEGVPNASSLCSSLGLCVWSANNIVSGTYFRFGPDILMTTGQSRAFLPLCISPSLPLSLSLSLSLSLFGSEPFLLPFWRSASP